MVILQLLEVFGQARFGTFVQVVIPTVVEAVQIVLHTFVLYGSITRASRESAM
jgi:hypothetical protein